jgi:hypothetical protein
MQCYTTTSDMVDIRYGGSGNYWFEIRNAAGKAVVDSRKAALSDGGVYGSSNLAGISAADYLFRNRIAFDAANNMRQVHSNIVSRYMSMLEYCRNKLADIELDADNPSYNNRDRTVPTLQSYIETLTKKGGELDLVISEVAKDVDGDDDAESLKALYDVRNQFTDILEYISRSSPGWMESSWKTDKTASSSVKLDFLPELACFYTDKACGAIGMANPKILGMSDEIDGYAVHVVDGDRKAVVHVSNDAMFRGVTTNSGPAPFTFGYYTDVIIPCLLAVGHLQPLDDDSVILLASRLMASGGDSYDALSCMDKKRRIVTFSPVRGNTSKGCSYAMEVSEPLTRSASSSQDINDSLKQNAESIMAADMVKIIKPGSEYEGMAGSVDGDRIEFFNTHIEFPVRIQMDNGLVTDVWMTDADVNVYMG